MRSLKRRVIRWLLHYEILALEYQIDTFIHYAQINHMGMSAAYWSGKADGVYQALNYLTGYKV